MIRTVALTPPYVKVYQLPVSGRGDLMKESSEATWKDLARAMAKQAGPAGRLVLRDFDPTSNTAAREEYEDVGPLFEAVAASALANFKMRVGRFETAWNGFEFSLGPLSSMAEVAKADAMLFVHVEAHIPTGARASLEAAGVMLSFFSGGPYFRGSLYSPGPLVSVVTALVHPDTGDLLWLHTRSYGGNPRVDATNAECLIIEALEHFRKAVAGQESTTKQPEHCGPGPEHLWR